MNYYTLYDDDDCEYHIFTADSFDEAKKIAQKETNRNKAPLTLSSYAIEDIRFEVTSE